MRRYSVAGTGATTSTTANRPMAVLWNPSSSVPLWVCEIEYDALTNTPHIRRTTTRGTPASTITPDIDNDYERGLAPPSGALLDLGEFTVSPTVETPTLAVFSPQGLQVLHFPRPIKIPPGAGLGFLNASGALASADVRFTWEE